MIFSDALPVQFWLTGCETFNEKEVDGVFSRCFCAPFNSSDEITIQFRDTSGYSRKLLVKNDIEETIYESLFTEVASGLYQASLIPENNGIIDSLARMLVIEPSQSVTVIAPNLWTDASAQTFDSKGATFFSESVSVLDTEILVYQPANVPSGETVVVTLTVTISSVTYTQGGFTLLAGLTDSSNVSVSTRETPDTFSYTSAHEGTFTQREIVTVDEGSTATRLSLRLAASGLTNGSANVVITVDVGQTIYLPETSILAKSDCLSIKEDHDETVLINYHNNRIFASLNSSVGTPDPEFNLRLYAIFSESDDRYPRESESMDLSDNTSLQTMAEIKKQRPLKIKHMPSYMHRKTILALSFQNVTIDGLTWEMREAYEKAPGNPKFPLKSAQVWLNDRNYTLRNVL